MLKETQDVGRAKETVAAVDAEIAALDAQFKAEADALGARTDPLTEPLETLSLKPTRQNISVRLVALAWAPCWRHAAGVLTPAWEHQSAGPSGSLGCAKAATTRALD